MPWDTWVRLSAVPCKEHNLQSMENWAKVALRPVHAFPHLYHTRGCSPKQNIIRLLKYATLETLLWNYKDSLFLQSGTAGCAGSHKMHQPNQRTQKQFAKTFFIPSFKFCCTYKTPPFPQFSCVEFSCISSKRAESPQAMTAADMA